MSQINLCENVRENIGKNENLRYIFMLLHMEELNIDKRAKWKTWELRQILTAGPVGMGGKSRQYTTLYSCIEYRHNCLSIPTGSVVGTVPYSAQLPRLPF